MHPQRMEYRNAKHFSIPLQFRAYPQQPQPGRYPWAHPTLPTRYPRRSVDGEIVTFNCGVPAFVLKKGQLEDDIGPRLVSMVRNIEAALGIH